MAVGRDEMFLRENAFDDLLAYVACPFRRAVPQWIVIRREILLIDGNVGVLLVYTDHA